MKFLRYPWFAKSKSARTPEEMDQIGRQHK